MSLRVGLGFHLGLVDAVHLNGTHTPSVHSRATVTELALKIHACCLRLFVTIQFQMQDLRGLEALYVELLRYASVVNASM